MKKSGVLCFMFGFISVNISILYADEIQNRVEKLTTEVSPQVIEWRRHIHAHPELSNREVETSRYVAEQLRTMNLDDIKEGIGKYGVVALIKGNHPGATVAIRADMDALPVTENTGLAFASQNPGVMHACGHDIHTSILLGVAKILSQMRDHIYGSVKFIFQPAEEGAPTGEAGGAALMIKEGVLQNPDVSAAFALHVNPEISVGNIGYRFDGIMAATNRFKITVTGKQTHAALPWRGVDPVIASVHIITALQTIASRINDAREPIVVSVCIVQGGNRWNIIPEQVALEGTVRTLNLEVQKKVREAFDRIVNNTAEAHGVKVAIDFSEFAPITWNSRDLEKTVVPSLQRSIGKKNLEEIKPSTGGEDFGYIAQKVPGFYYFLGVRNETIGAVNGLHTPNFIADESCIPVGLRSMSLLALDYLHKD